MFVSADSVVATRLLVGCMVLCYDWLIFWVWWGVTGLGRDSQAVIPERNASVVGSKQPVEEDHQGVAMSEWQTDEPRPTGSIRGVRESRRVIARESELPRDP